MDLEPKGATQVRPGGKSTILGSAEKFEFQHRIRPPGSTTTPDFHVDVSKQPVALSTSFAAVVERLRRLENWRSVPRPFWRSGATSASAGR